jgi:hypothetical protein
MPYASKPTPRIARMPLSMPPTFAVILLSC